MGALSGVMTGACETMTVANEALDALSFAASGVEKAIQAIKKLTAYMLSSVGFRLANSVDPSVTLNIAIMNTETQAINNYELELSLNGASFGKVAEDAFKSIFEPIQEQALETVTALKEKVKLSTEELILLDKDEVLFDAHAKQRLIMVEMYEPPVTPLRSEF